MKRIFVILLCCVWYGASYGTTFCAKSDKIVLGADFASSKATGGASAGFDWSINLENIGVVRGVSSCSSLKPLEAQYDCAGSGVQKYWGQLTASNGDVNENYYGRNDGGNCWCKMTHPFESGWVHMFIYNADCSVNCASRCVDYLSSRTVSVNQNYGDRTWACMLATVGLND